MSGGPFAFGFGYAPGRGAVGGGGAPAVSPSSAGYGIKTHSNQPSSLIVDGWLYTGGISGNTSGTGGGDVALAEISPAGLRTTYPLRTFFAVNDHLSPSLYRLSSGRIIAFYSNHSVGPTRYRISSNAAPGIMGFGTERTIPTTNPAGGNAYIFNVIRLSDGKVYLFRRQLVATLQWQIEMMTTTEADLEAGTETWTATNFIVPPTVTSGVSRPYPVLCKNGDDRIDVFTSRGNPDDYGNTGQIYHFYLQLVGGVLKVFQSDGTEVVTGLPINLDTQATLIRDESNGRNWPLQIKAGADGHPRVFWWIGTAIGAGAFNAPDGQYWYGRWTGSAWDTFLISDDNYAFWQNTNAGNACFDGNTTDTIYLTEMKTNNSSSVLCRFNVDEVNKVLTNRTVIDDGGSELAVRPFSPEGHDGTNHTVQWNRGTGTSFTSYVMQNKTLGLVNNPAAAPASLNAVTTAYLARLTTQPDATERNRIDRFISNLAAKGILAKLDALYLNAAFSQEASLLNVMSASFPLSVVGSPVFTAGVGWQGITSTGAYLAITGGNPAAFTQFQQNSASIGSFVTNVPGSGSQTVIGRITAGSPVLLTIPFQLRLNGSTILTDGWESGRPIGYAAGNRLSSTTITSLTDLGQVRSGAATSSARDTEALNYLRNSGHRQRVGFIGAGLTVEEHSAIAAACYEYSGLLW